jgi:hypothetical protein
VRRFFYAILIFHILKQIEMQQTTVQTVTLTGIGKTVPSQYASQGRPDRTCVTFAGIGDIWLDAPVVSSLHVGKSYVLVQAGKSWQVSQHSIAQASMSATGTGASVPVVTPARSGELSRERREELYQSIQFQAKLLHTCYRKIADEFQNDNLAEERICAFATSMFIGFSRQL